VKQNIYDNPEFFDGYMEMRANDRDFNGTIEEPTIRSLLPPLTGLRVLDLGCGFGKFVSFCLQEGAASVMGVDISQNMLSAAKKRIADPRARFVASPIEDFEAGAASFDLAVASMCLHYVRDIRPVFHKVAGFLDDGGMFVFSVEHPICTSLLQGWCGSADDPQRHWPVDDYKQETRRISTWFVDGVVKYHRTVETYVNGLIDAGFVIRRLLEPGPGAADVEKRPDLSVHLRRPPILVLCGIRRTCPAAC
jgi:ubiquinone/menaquinone biosynthesis C-methylase UbiE